MTGSGLVSLVPEGTRLDGEPVFVLCAARSGSTLLRLVLDAHPVLACPPETNLPALLEQLAVVWSLAEGSPLPADRGHMPPVVPDSAVAGVRRTVDMIMGSYLARRGKRRFCDKTLGTARFADLLVRVYPAARFLCLYRHPMDMIRSSLDACPWGLTGYGFEPFAAASPVNAVAALASYWAEHAGMIAAVEEAYPERCHRVRYEDLVAAPEPTTAAIFSFLDLPAEPGLAGRCVAERAEPFGPGDHKIWSTSAINADSVGSGQSVPAALIPPPVAARINALLSHLGYVAVDEDWGTPGRPADPRVPGTRLRDPVPVPGQPDGSVPCGQPLLMSLETEETAGQMLAERLQRAVRHAGDRFSNAKPGWPAERVLIVVRGPQAAAVPHEQRWLVDLASGTVEPTGDGTDEADWSMVGSPGAWQAVLTGKANLSTEVRQWRLRYSDPGDSPPFGAQARISLLAGLLAPAGQQEPPAGLGAARRGQPSPAELAT